ncbi:hypothetical protein ACG3SL_08645 [Sphingomonas sp. CJ20]
MAKGQQKTNKEVRKPKKAGPPKPAPGLSAHKESPVPNLIKRV